MMMENKLQYSEHDNSIVIVATSATASSRLASECLTDGERLFWVKR